ncbi:MAG: hypothetical protein QOE35_3878 [Actinomycetota bacterium]|jgi:hypothetical protein
MPVRATCPACGVALFTPSDGFSAEAMVERHQRFGRCTPREQPDQVERSAVTDEDGRDGRWAERGRRLA